MLTTDVDLERDIAAFREKRVGKLVEIVKILDADLANKLAGLADPIRWGLSHHVYRSLSITAREGKENARDLVAKWRDAVDDFSSEVSPIITDVSNTRIVEIKTDMPVHVLEPLAAAECAAVKVIRSGRDLLESANYGSPVATGLGVVVALKPRQLGEEVSSWTTTAFPGTIYSDYYLQPEFFAKDLIHEASHNWLNDALNATGVVFDPAEKYFSPWKNAYRSAYAMLHSITAFSRVVGFLKTLAQTDVADDVRAYCSARVKQERQKLSSAMPAALECFQLCSDKRISNLILGDLQTALG
jgi:HEXXH motif-containing protein